MIPYYPLRTYFKHSVLYPEDIVNYKNDMVFQLYFTQKQMLFPYIFPLLFFAKIVYDKKVIKTEVRKVYSHAVKALFS